MTEEHQQLANLEIESFKIIVNTSGETVSKTENTKIEHKKLLGVFLLLKGGNQLNHRSTLKMQINGENIVSQTPFKAFLIEKTNSLSVDNSMWKLDKNINVSKFDYEYVDGGDSPSYPYELTICLLCKK